MASSTRSNPDIQRMRDGDELAFARIFDGLSLPLALLIRREAAAWLRSDCDEEDLLQELASKAWSLRAEFRDESISAMQRWLVALARGLIGDRRRYVMAKGRGAVRHWESLVDGEGRRLEVAARGSSISARLERVDELDRVDRALSSLPETQRMAVEGHLILGESLAQTAQRLGVSKNAAFERLHRGMAELRRRLDAEVS